jgi:hypothetical protein
VEQVKQKEREEEEAVLSNKKKSSVPRAEKYAGVLSFLALETVDCSEFLTSAVITRGTEI